MVRYVTGLDTNGDVVLTKPQEGRENHGVGDQSC